MTTARALEPLHPQVVVNASVPVHTVAASKLVDAGGSISDRVREDGERGTETLTEEELRQLLDGAVAAKLFLPSVTPELIARIGVTDAVLEGIDVGLRYNGNVIKGDIKLQFWESEDGSQQLAFDVGYGHHTGLVSSVIEWVTLTEFSRKDIDLALLWSMELGDLGRILLSPRVLLGHVSVDTKIPSWVEDNLPDELRDYDPGPILPRRVAGLRRRQRRGFLGIQAHLFGDRGRRLPPVLRTADPRPRAKLQLLGVLPCCGVDGHLLIPRSFPAAPRAATLHGLVDIHADPSPEVRHHRLAGAHTVDQNEKAKYALFAGIFTWVWALGTCCASALFPLFGIVGFLSLVSSIAAVVLGIQGRT